MSTTAAMSRLLARVTAIRADFEEVEQLADQVAEPRVIELALIGSLTMLHIAEQVQDLQAADEDCDDWGAGFGEAVAGA